MTRGTTPNRNGSRPQPGSARSDQRGIKFVTLPSEGYSGKAPIFPLPDATPRERAVWRKAWTYPQAAVWSEQSWRWEQVAMWVRWKVRAESAEASAADATAMHRLADQIGMTPAGLRENGWQIAPDEIRAARTTKSERAAATATEPPSRRLRSAAGGAA